MELSLDQGHGTYKIESYSSQGIKINGTVYNESLMLMPEKLIVPWGPSPVPRSVKDLTADHFNEMMPLHPQVVLLGTGDTIQYPNSGLYGKLIANSIGVEIMSNAAACRTYTLLMAEGRAVLVAFLLNINT